MASIQVTETPFLLGPNPVENCVEMCFEAIDAIDKSAFQALACMVFTDGVAPFNDGDQIIFAGVPINIGTAGDGSSTTSTLDLTSTSVTTNLQIFEDWLNATYPFNVDTDIFIGGFGNIATICVRWCDYGPRPNFIFSSPPNNNVVQYAQGSFAELIEGFKLVYQLICLDDDLNEDKSSCPRQVKEFTRDETGAPQITCIDMQKELSKRVYTEFPKCDDPVKINEPMMKWFTMKYGFSQRNPETNCGTIFSEFESSPPFLIINQAINLEDGDNGASCYRMQDNLGEIKFLTSKDVTAIRACKTACEWLYVAGTWQSFNPDFIAYEVQYTFFDENGNQLLTFPQDVEEDGVIQIPAGPQSIIDAIFPLSPGFPDVICSYEIQVNVATDAGVIPYSEKATFLVDHNCCCDESIYYLDPKGGYSRMAFDCIESSDFIDESIEICLDTPCGDFESELMAGKYNANSKGYTTRTYITKPLKKTEATECELKAFKTSQSKFFLYTDKKGETNNRRVVSTPGSTRIMQKDGKIVLTITLIESQDYNSISNG